MKLQLTLDTPLFDECLDLVEKVQDSIDIVEVGNPELIEAGLPLVRMIKERYPQLTVVADAKIYHSGRYIAARCLDSGADIVTVLAATSDEVIAGAVAGATDRAKYVMADLAGESRPAVRAYQLEELGVKYMCVPTALPDPYKKNVQAEKVTGLGTRIKRAVLGQPLSRARAVKSNLTHAELAVVGNIDVSNLDVVLAAKPDAILIGRAIVNAEDPAAAARKIRAFVDAWEAKAKTPGQPA